MSPKKASRRPKRSMRNCWEEVKQKLQQNNDADLYLADQIAQLQKLVISLQTGQTIVAESNENRMNELAQKIDAMSEPAPDLTHPNSVYQFNGCSTVQADCH